MKTLKFFTKVFLVSLVVGFSWLAHGQVVIDSLTVQGYMKKANGTAVTNGTYNIVYGVRQNGSTVWAKQISTTVTSGLFSANLSGTGTDLSALSAGTGMNANYSAVTLNPALLQSSGAGGIIVRVYANSAIDGSNPQFDITLNSVPTSFVANVAQNVATGSVGLTGIATAAKAASSTGVSDGGKIALLNSSGVLDGTLFPATLPAVDGSALTNVAASSVASGAVSVGGIASASKSNTSSGAGDAGKIVLLNSSGKIDNTMFPSTLPAADGSALTNVTASAVAAGSVTTAGIAAGSKASTSAGAGDSGKLVLLNGSGLVDSTMISGLSLAQGGTGGTSAATARISLGAAASGANSDITSMTGLTRAALGTSTTITIAAGAGTTYSNASPIVYSTTVLTMNVTGVATSTTTFNCIDSSNAVTGSLWIWLYNPTSFNQTFATPLTLSHNSACTGNNKPIITNTAAAVTTAAAATGASPAYMMLMYNGTAWQLLSYLP